VPAAMGPVKFDDLAKTATEVLNDDFQTSDWQMKAKQKTSWDGATATTTVDLLPPGDKGGVSTPAKISWKLPKPFGVAGLCVDKFEMDKGGKFKLETTADKGLHTVDHVKLEVKSDLVDVAKATAGLTYTGVADTQIKIETKPMNPADFSLEVTRAMSNVTLGLKCGMATLTKPDVGLRFEQGPLFAAFQAKNGFSVFTGHAYYKVQEELKLAATYEMGGAKSGNFSAGVAYELIKGTTFKAKLQQDMSIHCGLKHEMAKGFTVLGGLKYETESGKHTMGLQVSIE